MVELNEKNFPCERFRKFLSRKFNVAEGDCLKDDVLQRTVEIDCHNQGIEDLTGIGNFEGLRILKCYENDISELVISNPELVEIDCQCNNVHRLVLNCPKLLCLYFSDNPIEFISLYTLPKLGYLECQNCGLVDLDVSNNTELRQLCCQDNGLKKLDISKNRKLEELFCEGNEIDADKIKKTNPEIVINGIYFGN